ncbi:pyridoxamine 5'-phosphate oxidase family protein [Rhizobium leguminosarum]|uniref:pyridoxamine 5'-phosphate oxidase family protein n=1 Tax=Rhizobium leguminosarum TaxID=384 RepID=UPI001C97CC17|nr:pyridoxamine 5'-phosphate oxidase family protein [Rhizobium leguminosarum]MBY5591641.1 pyridoxamine 5'-phosphate oxidase family protein [Rhizobium leguminosarum]MBY5602698.1 pyridoxamine 5'-phosphate oxidase family protein [Rhizobium leguminosarum]
MLGDKIAGFIESPVMQIIGSSNAARRPEIGRAVGAWTSAESDTIDLVTSAWQWPETVANLRENGRIAVTFARPADYVSYQLKGQATIRPAESHEVERSSQYIVAIVSTQMRLGLLPELIMPVLSNRDPMLITMRVASVYVQTPGSHAGERIWSTTP